MAVRGRGQHVGADEQLETLSSSSDWSFPPRPDTHHVRWIGCHPVEPERLWVAIESGALVSTIDGGRTWRDRVPGGPWDTHELAVHPNAPDTLRVSAGDGYFESDNAGATCRSPSAGLEVGYLRSVAIDPKHPDVVVVSASSGPHSAYVAGRSDGRLFVAREYGSPARCVARHRLGLIQRHVPQHRRSNRLAQKRV